MKIEKLFLLMTMMIFCISLWIACDSPHTPWDELILDLDGKRVFVTLSTYNGNLGGVAGADAKCNADANKPTSSTYRALIVDGVNRIASMSANAGDGQYNWVLQPNTNYYLNDGTFIITTNANSIFTGSMNNPFGGGGDYWTGLNSDWTTASVCNNEWTVNGGSGSTGSNTATNNLAISSGNSSCSNSPTFKRRLLCIEQ